MKYVAYPCFSPIAYSLSEVKTFPIYASIAYTLLINSNSDAFKTVFMPHKEAPSFSVILASLILNHYIIK